MRQRDPVEPEDVLFLQPGESLPDFMIGAKKVMKGDSRCAAVGLPLGDCRQRKVVDGAYCYYHDKLQRGLTTPTAATYPVWPLPSSGYRFNTRGA